MRGVAVVSFAHGGIILPVNSPYERELFFEHLSSLARRYNRVHAELPRQRWEVASADADDAKGGSSADRCATCAQALQGLRYRRSDRRLFCGWCAKREMR